MYMYLPVVAPNCELSIQQTIDDSLVDSIFRTKLTIRTTDIHVPLRWL